MVQVTGEVTEDTGRLGWVQLLRQRSFVVPQLLTCALFLFQATCGCDLVAFYNGIIFADYGIRPEVAAIVFQLTISLGRGGKGYIQEKKWPDYPRGCSID